MSTPLPTSPRRRPPSSSPTPPPLPVAPGRQPRVRRARRRHRRARAPAADRAPRGQDPRRPQPVPRLPARRRRAALRGVARGKPRQMCRSSTLHRRWSSIGSSMPLPSGSRVVYVEQPEYLSAWRAEVHVLAAAMLELRDAGLAKPLLAFGDVPGAEFDPGSPKRVLVIQLSRWDIGRRQFGELDAERTPICKPHEHDRVVETEVAFDHRTPEDFLEEPAEALASVRLNEKVNARTKPDDLKIVIHHGRVLRRA
jgi:hypothetical protein